MNPRWKGGLETGTSLPYPAELAVRYSVRNRRVCYAAERDEEALAGYKVASTSLLLPKPSYHSDILIHRVQNMVIKGKVPRTGRDWTKAPTVWRLKPSAESVNVRR